MEYILIILLSFIPPAICILISQLRMKKYKVPKRASGTSFAVGYPKGVAFLGALTIGESMVLMLGFTLFSKEQPHFLLYVFGGVFAWVGMYMIMIAYTFKIVIKKNMITVITALKKPVIFTFQDIISVVRQVKNNKVQSERIIVRTCFGRKYIVEGLADSYERLQRRIIEEVDAFRLEGF